MVMKKMYEMNNRPCSCGREHSFSAEVVTGKGAVRRIADYLQKNNFQKAYVLSDMNTWVAAGEQVAAVLEECSLPYTSFCFQTATLEPDEHSVGSAIMHYDTACDLIIGIGSGVINDISKIVSAVTSSAYIIVATAPSMDGYASATSSVTRDGLKISLNSRSADLIVGDTDILCNAPIKMMQAGLGDMLAKYVSICEWRLGHLITGEYYCEEVASLVRSALQRCVDNAAGLLNREETAVLAVFEGLVITGLAMKYAGCSRPASGMEHYISHSIDMRYEAFGTPLSLHGLQCAIGTLITARLYEKLLEITPDRQKALEHAAQFDLPAWHSRLHTLLGKGADTMIELEKKEHKYDLSMHRQRLERILSNWEEIRSIITEELPSAAAIEQLLDSIQAPKALSEIGTPDQLIPEIVRATKDIRDKYVFSRLAWDLGILDELLAETNM